MSAGGYPQIAVISGSFPRCFGNTFQITIPLFREHFSKIPRCFRNTFLYLIQVVKEQVINTTSSRKTPVVENCRGHGNRCAIPTASWKPLHGSHSSHNADGGLFIFLFLPAGGTSPRTPLPAPRRSEKSSPHPTDAPRLVSSCQPGWPANRTAFPHIGMDSLTPTVAEQQAGTQGSKLPNTKAPTPARSRFPVPPDCGLGQSS